MKICFIAPASNYHTIKWSMWFSSHGHEVHVISFLDAKIPNVTVHYIDAGVAVEDSDSKKIKYLLHGKEVRNIINDINPDVINAHYATSYGAVAALSGVKGYILSVWGSDVYNFPLKSPLHKALLKYSLKRAGHIFSTSQAMATETRKYTKKHIDITPFGVDMELFNPNKRNRTGEAINPEDGFIIGTVKSLTPKYGIDYLLKAASIVKEEHPQIPIKVRIAGKGDHEREYRKLAEELKIDNITEWLGFISQADAAKEWANFDIGVVYSTDDSESFGVSAVEAQACETPVIISDVPGLMEATLPGKTSIVVERKNAQKLADAIVELYNNPEKRLKMGQYGRQYVLGNYEINKCFRRINEHIIEYIGGVIDTNIYNPNKRTRVRTIIIPNEDIFVVGLVKGLSLVYGIEYLLYAVAEICKKYGEGDIEVRISGKGSHADYYKSLCMELGIDNIVTWLGFISQESAAVEWANMDLAIIPSKHESYGVSAIEALACGTPLAVSNIEGLNEIINGTGVAYSFETGNIDQLVKIVEKEYKKYKNKGVRNEKGRHYVKEKYEIDMCFKHIESLFLKYERKTISKKKMYEG